MMAELAEMFSVQYINCVYDLQNPVQIAFLEMVLHVPTVPFNLLYVITK
jgi:hypothetical protein